MTREKVPTIAFDGINRVGKGTQIMNLEIYAQKHDLSSIKIRGDGTRDGLGSHDGDPENICWQKYSSYIRSHGTVEDWNYAAYILALDIKYWKENGYNQGKQLVFLDRSLISRATFILDRSVSRHRNLSMEDLYPYQGSQRINLDDVLPDVIFELTAPKELVISRLDPNDKKFHFRSRIIEDQYERFYSAKFFLPEIIQERIITIDSAPPKEVVFNSVLSKLDQAIFNQIA